MTDDARRVGEDLEILANMASAMQDYLAGSALFGRSDHPAMPPVSLGATLMRLGRLQAVVSALDPRQQVQLGEYGGRLEILWQNSQEYLRDKLARELFARLHLWQGHLQEMADEEGVSQGEYATMAETRVLLAVLLQAGQHWDVPVPVEIISRMDALDQQLAQVWQAGDFVLPQVWQAAYPQQEYWWLYGLPGKVPAPSNDNPA